MSASACGKDGAASEHDTNSQSSDLGLLVQWAVDEATVAARVVVEVLSGTSGGVGRGWGTRWWLGSSRGRVGELRVR
jgi:hypothetical protein